MKKEGKGSEFLANLLSVVLLATFLIYETTLPSWWEESFPMAIGALTLLLFIWRMVSATFPKGVSKMGDEGEVKFGSRGLLIILSSLGLLGSIYLIGFLPASFLFLMVLPFVLGYKRWVVIAAIALTVILVFLLGDRRGILIFPKGLLF